MANPPHETAPMVGSPVPPRRRIRLQFLPHAVLLILVVTTFYPLVFTLLASLKSNAQFYSTFWVPTAPFHWENYLKAWKELSRGFLNSVVVSSVSVTGVVLMSGLAAWTFARYRWPGKEVLYYLILGLMMVPAFLTLVPLYWMVRELRLTGSLAAVFLPYLAGGQVFPIFLMRAFFENLPGELFDSARLDGAGEITIFLRIGMPLCVPIVITVAIMDVMGTWNDFFWPLLAVGQNRDLYTVMVRTFNLTGLMPDYGLLTSAYVIISVPLILMFIFGMRYYISGLTSGAVKM
ncbi:MAG TPA: carbohydrate ABC transporter permease [Spirochaetia bacterium]|nr:carbohydrate ABC transporter permease [Spirochaetia bacterium]